MQKKYRRIALLFVVIIIFSGIFIQAKAQAFSDKAIIISAGYGLIPIPHGVSDPEIEHSKGSTTSAGSFYLKLEKAVARHIGLGLNISYTNFKESYAGYAYNNVTAAGFPWNYTNNYNSLAALARMNIHFGKSSKFDPYAGLGVGYIYEKENFYSSINIPANSLHSPALSHFPLGIDLTAGLRYLITSGFGVYTEVGLTTSLLQGGVVIKL